MYRVLQAEADVDSLMEQVSQTDSKSRSPFKRRAGLTDEEMGMFASPALHDMFASPACSPQLQGRGSPATGGSIYHHQLQGFRSSFACPF